MPDKAPAVATAFSEGVRDEVGGGNPGGDVGERVGEVPRRHGQRLIEFLVVVGPLLAAWASV